MYIVAEYGIAKRIVAMVSTVYLDFERSLGS